MDKHKRLPAFLKYMRKQTKLTQVECALKAGVGLKFLRKVEQGKQTLNVTKVNQILALFGHELQPVRSKEIED
jgi:y4mF family transcriptional regulator